MCHGAGGRYYILFMFVCPYLINARNIFTSKMSSWINIFGDLSNKEKIHVSRVCIEKLV